MKENIAELLSTEFSTMNKKQLGIYFEKLIEMGSQSPPFVVRLEQVSQLYHQQQVQFFAESIRLLDETLTKVDLNSSAAKEIQLSIADLKLAQQIVQGWDGNPLDLKQRIQLTKVITNPTSLLNPAPKNTMMELLTLKSRVQRKIKHRKEFSDGGIELVKNLSAIIDAMNKANKDFQELKNIKARLLHFQEDIRNQLKNPGINNDHKELLETMMTKLDKAFSVFDQQYFSDYANIDRKLLNSMNIRSDFNTPKGELIMLLFDTHDLIRTAKSGISSTDTEKINRVLNELKKSIPNHDENIQQNLILIYNQLLDVRDLAQMNSNTPQTIFNEFNNTTDEASKKIFLDIFKKYSEAIIENNPLKAKLHIVISMIDDKQLLNKNYNEISRTEIDSTLTKLKTHLNNDHPMIKDFENLRWLKVAEPLKAEVIATALEGIQETQQESLLNLLKKIKNSSSEPEELKSKFSQVIDIIAAKKILAKSKPDITEADFKMAMELYSRLNEIKSKIKSFSQLVRRLKNLSGGSKSTHKNWVDENIQKAQAESKGPAETHATLPSVSPRGGESGKD